MTWITSDRVNFSLRFVRRERMSLIFKVTDFILGKLISKLCQELDATWISGKSGRDEIIHFLIFRKLVDDHLPEFHLGLIGVSPLPAHLVNDPGKFILLVF